MRAASASATDQAAPAHDDGPFLLRLVLMIAASLTVMSGATISPSLPQIGGQFPDASPLMLRLVLTLPALFIAFCAPLAGWVADAFGRKRLILFGTGLYVLAGSSGLWAWDLPSLLAGRALLGVAVACIMTTVTTLVGDYFTGETRNKHMGQQAAFMAFGGFVFLNAGGLLAEADWRGPFLVYLAPLALIPLMMQQLYEPDRGTREERAARAAAEPTGTRALLPLLPVYAASFLLFVAFYMVPTQLPFMIEHLGMGGPSAAGLAIAAMTALSGITSLFYGRIKRLASYPTIVAAGFLFMASGYIGISQAPSYLFVMLSLAVAGIGGGLIMPSVSLWILSLAPEAIRGRAMGANTGVIFLGQFLSPILIAPLIGTVGEQAAYGVGGLVLIGVALVYLLQRKSGYGFTPVGGGGPAPAAPQP